MMVDYIIANSMALGMIDKIMIDDFLPRTNSRNYHSHLMIMTQFGGGQGYTRGGPYFNLIVA